VGNLAEGKFSLSSDYNLVGDTSALVHDFLLKSDTEQHICNAIDICLTEALNNVIKHAYKGELNHPIEINVVKDSKLLEVQIIDKGSSRDSLEIKDLDFDPEDINNLPEGGMGLYIMKQLMDELDYYSLNGRNFFTLRKYLY
jgi:serine/threonine-protein kinase RsbW